MVSGLLGVGASGAGAAGLGGAFCSGIVGCSPDFLEAEAGRADAGVCGAVAGEGCTSFFLMAAMRSRLKDKSKLFEVLKISELREEEVVLLGSSAKIHLLKRGLGASSGTTEIARTQGDQL